MLFISDLTNVWPYGAARRVKAKKLLNRSLFVALFDLISGTPFFWKSTATHGLLLVELQQALERDGVELKKRHNKKFFKTKKHIFKGLAVDVLHFTCKPYILNWNYLKPAQVGRLLLKVTRMYFLRKLVPISPKQKFHCVKFSDMVFKA